MGWSNQAVSLIVLTEADGGYSGFFAYSPAEGANKLVLSLTAAALEDPYGNQVPPGLTVYDADTPGIALNLQFAGVFASMINADGDLSQQGAWTIYVEYWQDADVFFTSTPVVIQEPGAAIGTPETWHQVTALGSGWSNSGNGVDGAYYQMTASGQTEIILDVAFADDPATTTIFTLPAAYRPVTPSNHAAGTYSDTVSPHVMVATSGAVVAEALPAAPGTLVAHLFVPLGAL